MAGVGGGGRGLAWLTGLSLDVKLGGRMLLKYPGLTLAGGLAIAVAIGLGRRLVRPGG
jgi:putative ABC transport system permease protein